MQNWINTWDDFLENSVPPIKNYILKEKKFFIENIEKNQIILDAGCGKGGTIKILAKKSKKIVGIDISDDILIYAKKITHNNKNVELFKESIDKLHFADSYFDIAILGMNTFGNLHNNKVNVLKELIRVVKPDGRIYISTYSEKALDDRLKSYEASKIKYKIMSHGKIQLDSSFNNKVKIITEQFSKSDLQKIFTKLKQKFKIIKLNKISYMSILTVKK